MDTGGHEFCISLLVGPFLTAVINFLLVAAAIYFFVIVPTKLIMDRVRRPQGEQAKPVPPAEDIVLLTEIRNLLAARSAENTHSTHSTHSVHGTRNF